MPTTLPEDEVEARVAAIWAEHERLDRPLSSRDVVKLFETEFGVILSSLSSIRRQAARHNLPLPDIWPEHKLVTLEYKRQLEEGGLSGPVALADLCRIFGGVDYSVAQNRIDAITKWFPEYPIEVIERPYGSPEDGKKRRLKPPALPPHRQIPNGFVVVPNGVLVDEKTGKVRYRYLII